MLKLYKLLSTKWCAMRDRRVVPVPFNEASWRHTELLKEGLEVSGTAGPILTLTIRL